MYAFSLLCIHTCAHRQLRPAETQIPVHLRSLEGRQNICMLLLMCSCNKRSCRERNLRSDQIKTSACVESALASVGPESAFTHPQQRSQRWSCHTCLLMSPHTCSRLHLPEPLWLSSFHKYRPVRENSTELFLSCVIIPERSGSNHTHTHTLVFLSYVSLNCICFPALLPRSSHLPFSHFMAGFLVRLVESTLAMKATSVPVIDK